MGGSLSRSVGLEMAAPWGSPQLYPAVLPEASKSHVQRAPGLVHQLVDLRTCDHQRRRDDHRVAGGAHHQSVADGIVTAAFADLAARLEPLARLLRAAHLQRTEQA